MKKNTKKQHHFIKTPTKNKQSGTITDEMTSIGIYGHFLKDTPVYISSSSLYFPGMGHLCLTDIWQL